MVKKGMFGQVVKNSIIVIVSVGIALGAIEVFLRNTDYTTGDGSGSAMKRWTEKYWKPINELGFRDFQLSEHPSGKEFIFFLGDSFTAGHGVKFNETYYHIVRNLLPNDFYAFNLGAIGASTKTEKQVYQNFVGSTKVYPETVIHQYFVNDIDDYIKMPKIQPLPALFSKVVSLSNLLESVASIYNTIQFSTQYIDSLTEAYLDKAVFAQHVNDIDELHGKIREKGARVYFVLFPFLNSEKSTRMSSKFLNEISNNFVQKCSPGDVVINPTSFILTLNKNDRVASYFDAHPSPAVHKYLGEMIFKLISGKDVSAEIENKTIVFCPN